MPFKFERQNLTSQQRAILDKNDKAEAESEKQYAEKKLENEKIEATKNFISNGQTFDVVIMKDRKYEVEVTNYHNIRIEIKENKMIFIELARQGEITAAGVDEIGERALKLSFIDQDKNRIFVRIIKRQTTIAP